ncbi:MAG: hypothetical protein RI996_117 [Candidatus Parcubacteria bacterium]|jgi:hypothetical protein
MHTKLSKIYQFAIPRLQHAPIYLIQYACAYFQKGYTNSASFYTEAQTIEKIQQGKSLVRLGDGEAMLLSGVGIWYQEYEKSLGRELRALITKYTNQSNYILTLPQKYTNVTNTELRNISIPEFNALHAWLPIKIWYKMIFPKNAIYADTCVFYSQHFFDQIIPYLKTKKIIVITTQKNIDAQKNRIEKDLHVISWIEAKAPNPYEWYEKYKLEIVAAIELAKASHKDIVILLSAGPASKPLAVYCSNIGIQAIDMGHGFEYLGDLARLEKQVI